MTRLSRILIYPIKSLDPVEVPRATVLPGGALEYDRRWAIFDADGRAVTAKRFAKIHLVRARYDLAEHCVNVSFASTSGGESFHLDHDSEKLAAWLGDRLGIAGAAIREDAELGYPDDPVSPGPTVISTATPQSVADWFPGLSVDEVRRRFRANLELDADEPFWEERLYTDEGQVIRFRIGSVEFEGTNPCQRCIVPTRSATTGEKTPDFTRIFEERRFETLPAWSTRSRFDHFYRLAVNSAHSTGAGGVIRIGDQVQIIG